MITVHCRDCGGAFRREASDTWRVRCIACWRETRATPRVPARVVDELHHNLRGMIQLCHPDRHHGSPLAGQITTWLLRIRRELRL